MSSLFLQQIWDLYISNKNIIQLKRYCTNKYQLFVVYEVIHVSIPKYAFTLYSIEKQLR